MSPDTPAAAKHPAGVCGCEPLSAEAATNPHGYDPAEWSATYDAPLHLYPGGGTGYENTNPGDGLPRHSLVYLSGPPGVGKSTLMAELTRHCPRDTITTNIARDLLNLPAHPRRLLQIQSAVELGRRRDRFSGTDALPMNAVVAAEEYMLKAGKSHGLVLAEGDRLANARFLDGARRAGWYVTLIHLDAPAELLDARCAQRGSTQNPSWRAGRVTKARNLANAIDAAGHHVVRLDGRNDVACLVQSCLEYVPVLAALLPRQLEDGPQAGRPWSDPTSDPLADTAAAAEHGRTAHWEGR